MVRRLPKNNDIRDIIKSVPDYVVNDITEIQYYVYGYEDDVITPAMSFEGDIIKVIISSDELQTLPDGLLYRKCFYNKEDAEYPDGQYNLEIVDNMGIWLESKENSVQPPIGSNYLQEDDLKTINGESIVGSGDITIQATGGVTEEWVNSQGYATETWVSNQGYLTEHQSLADYALKSEIPDVSGYATQEWVESKGYVTAETLPEGIATQSWVTNQGYITSVPDTFATKDWVSTQGYLTEHQDLSSYALKSEIPSLDGYATESWVESKGYLTEHQSLAGYALKSEIPDVSGYALKTEIPSLDGYVQETNLKTINGESIVGSGDITIQATGGVTEEWVTSQGYATETWVSNQGYLTEHQSLADYALKSEIPDVSGYALKTEIPDVTGYATQTYVDNKIGQIDTLLDQMLG